MGRYGAQLATRLNGGTLNLREVIELARLGRIEKIEDRYPLSRVEGGYNDLRNGKLRGRAVLIREVDDLAVRENLAHGVDENVPFVDGMEIVAHEEAAAGPVCIPGS